MNMFAMVFPGQGSQKIGMLSKLAKKFSLVEESFSEASDILGYDLWKLTQIGPIQELNKTSKAQPALLSASISIWRIWKYYNGHTPSLFSGHSLGEYSALVCSDSLKFSSAIKLVELRGKFMEEAAPLGMGAMSAIIGLDSNLIVEICKKSEQGQIVSPASFNSNDQTVISGHVEAVKRAEILCRRSKAKIIIPLLVSVPSHCLLMKPASKKLYKILEEISFSSPKIPIVNSIDAKIERNISNIRNKLTKQLYSPVLWLKTVKYLIDSGIELFLEIGPSNVLTKLIKNITYNEKNIKSKSINDPTSLSKAINYYNGVQ